MCDQMLQACEPSSTCNQPETHPKRSGSRALSSVCKCSQGLKISEPVREGRSSPRSFFDAKAQVLSSLLAAGCGLGA